MLPAYTFPCSSPLPQRRPKEGPGVYAGHSPAMPREEDQEIRDRLKSIENFNNDEPHLSPAHHETSHVQYNMLTQSQMFGPIDLGDTFELRNRSLTFHGHNEIFNSLGASAMEM